MNEVLSKIIEYRRKKHEQMMWDIIFDIGWGIKTVDYKLLKKYLLDNYSDKEIKRIKEFAIFKRRELKVVLNKFENDIGVPGYYAVGDDGFWDLTAHIVGLGKVRYESVMKDPSIARLMSINNMFKENFEYSFNVEQ